MFGYRDLSITAVGGRTHPIGVRLQLRTPAPQSKKPLPKSAATLKLATEASLNAAALSKRAPLEGAATLKPATEASFNAAALLDARVAIFGRLLKKTRRGDVTVERKRNRRPHMTSFLLLELSCSI